MSTEGSTDGERRRWGLWVLAGGVALLVLLLVLALSGGRISRIDERLGTEGDLVQQVREALPAAIREQLFPMEEEGAVIASGTIQAEQVVVSSQFGGRVVALPVAEGETVREGALLLRLDTEVVDAQIRAAEAAVALAQAVLAEARAGARPGQLAVAEAELAQAQAAQAAATHVISRTTALVGNPQELLLQIAVARAQLATGEHELNQAVAVKDAAEAAKNFFEDVNDQWGNKDSHKALVKEGGLDQLPEEIQGQLDEVVDGSYTIGDFELDVQGSSYELYRWVDVNIPLQLHLTPNSWWQAWVGVNAAQARQEGRQHSLSHLYAQYNNPQALQAQVDAAVAALAEADARVALAEAQVAGLQAGPTEEELAALTARVREAESALASLQAEKALRVVRAPLEGMVLACLAHRGEVVAAGAPLMEVADLSRVTVTLYVPETRLGQVYLGQAVEISVDAFPERVFRGQVSHIAGSAEYTPRNVATREERVNLVFAVEVSLDNEEGLLKPGMAADARFLTEGGGS